MKEESYEDIFGDNQGAVAAAPAAAPTRTAAPPAVARAAEAPLPRRAERQEPVRPATPAQAPPRAAAPAKPAQEAQGVNFLDAPTHEHDLTVGQGQSYKFMQWVEADPRAPKGSFQNLGGFFIPESQFPFGFEPSRDLDIITFEDGKELKGIGFNNTAFAILGYRLDWYANIHGKKNFFPSYDKGIEEVGAESLRGRTRYVVLVKNEGLWKHAPVMLTISGTKGKALQESINAYDNSLRRTLERKYGKRFEPYRFWCPIKPSANRVKVSEKFNKYTVPPVLGLPEKFDPIEIGQKAFVGPEVLKVAAGYWDEVQEWAKAKVGGEHGEPQVVKVGEDSEAAAAAPVASSGDAFGGGAPADNVEDYFNS